jgi:hypothetical protein
MGKGVKELPKMADIFISYAREDANVAQAFYHRLAAAGLSVFLDTVSLAPGAPWSQKIREELKTARTVLVLASHKAIHSAMVNQESGAAALNGKKVIPVLWDMDPAQLSGWLREYQALDLRGQDARHIHTRVETFVQQLVLEKQKLEVIVAVGLVGLAAIAIFAK